MLRRYGKVSTAIFTDELSAQWSDTAFRIAIYLLAGPHSNSIGCFRLPKGYVAEDLGKGIETVSEGFQELSEAGFIRYCDRTKHVWMPKFLLHNQFENPNVAKAALKILGSIPKECGFIPELLDTLEVTAKFEFAAMSLQAEFQAAAEPLRNGTGTLPEPLPEPFPNPEPEPEPKPEPKPVSRAAKAAPRARAPSLDFDALWAQYPKRSGANPKAKAARAASARIKSGWLFEDLLRGTIRYREWCDAGGKSDTEYVMQAVRFYGPDDLFSDEWAVKTETKSHNQRLLERLTKEGAFDD